MKITAKDIEVALTCNINSPFYMRRWIVLPNVYWSLEDHECDILAVSSSNYAHEIEIKISTSDLKRDFDKHLFHKSLGNKVKCLWFAAPLEMQDAMFELLPDYCGIITVNENLKTKIERKAKSILDARKFNDKEIRTFARVAAMRYWNLRMKIYKEKLEINENT